MELREPASRAASGSDHLAVTVRDVVAHVLSYDGLGPRELAFYVLAFTGG